MKPLEFLITSGNLHSRTSSISDVFISSFAISSYSALRFRVTRKFDVVLMHVSPLQQAESKDGYHRRLKAMGICAITKNFVISHEEIARAMAMTDATRFNWILELAG